MTRKVFADKGRIETGEDNNTPAAEVSKMPTKFEREQALRDATLDNIGTPDDLQRVDIKQLFDVNHYRVNVYRTIKGLVQMTDSFYVVMTPDEVTSLPPMTKKYYDADLGRLMSSYFTS